MLPKSIFSTPAYHRLSRIASRPSVLFIFSLNSPRMRPTLAFSRQNYHSDGGNWVCCDGCNVWVHAECDKISDKLLKWKTMDWFMVAGSGTYGLLLPRLQNKSQLVMCKCGSCGSRKQTLGEWERHTDGLDHFDDGGFIVGIDEEEEDDNPQETQDIYRFITAGREREKDERWLGAQLHRGWDQEMDFLRCKMNEESRVGFLFAAVPHY
ncbi:hypothetical protein K1719_044262 [Acacia pycnantha]|nr:hypothetical protein K1719_044262 [Acacia pycnantha]